MRTVAYKSVLVTMAITLLSAHALACFKTSTDTVRLRSHGIRGTLKGSVMPGMRVSLHKKDNRFVFAHYDANSASLLSAEPDENGKFNFGAVAPASYVLSGGTLEPIEVVLVVPSGTQDDQLQISSIGICQVNQAVDTYGIGLFSNWSDNAFLKRYWDIKGY